MSSTVLDLTDVVFRRGGTELIQGVHWRIEAGEHWALLGPNGAGKSTLLGFCSAQVHPTSGTVDVLGKRLGRVELQELRRHIGHVNPRHPLQTALTVHQVVLTGITGTVEMSMRWTPTDAQVRTADELIDEVGLTHRRDARWPHLSQGERGRALIARALLAQPELLLLDEPTTGLDVAAREQLLTVLDRLAHTAPEVASVLVTHHLEELPTTTTHALLLAHGQVVAAGPVAETVTTETITRTFDHPIEVDHDGGRWRARALPPARLHSA